MSINDLRNKKICLLGLGLENLSLAKYLAKQGIVVSVLDKRGRKELGNRYEAIKKIKTEFYSGLDYLNKVLNFDIVFKTPGFIGKLKTKKNAIITTPVSLFFDLCPAKIIAITGTKGKGTAASLIFEILKTAGENVWLAGNIGTAPFDFIDKLKPDHFVVLELSSFQLIDFKKRPRIAVVTNLFPEHLAPADPINPIFHGSLKEYYTAKANIFLNQTQNDWLIVNKNNHHNKSILRKSKARKVYFQINKNLPKNRFLIGNHNRENVAAACAVAKILKIPKKAIQRAVQNFKVLEHHLEFVREINGIKFYNDSASTMPTAALAAARAFDEDIILIVGGMNKGYDLKKFARQLSQLWQPIAVVLIGKTAKELESYFSKQKTSFMVFRINGGINEIVNNVFVIAFKLSGKTPVVFSPGFASFDMFENSKDRGEKFKKAILALN